MLTENPLTHTLYRLKSGLLEAQSIACKPLLGCSRHGRSENRAKLSLLPHAAVRRISLSTKLTETLMNHQRYSAVEVEFAVLTATHTSQELNLFLHKWSLKFLFYLN